MIIIPVLLGFVLGFCIGLTGIGGGALVAPALYVILGLSYTQAVALSLIYSFLTKVLGFVQHVRQDNVRWGLSAVYGLTGVPGAVLGSELLYWSGDLSNRFFPILMGIVLIGVSSLIFFDATTAWGAGRPRWDPDELPLRRVIGIGLYMLVVGGLLGTTSIGSGSLVVLSLVLLFEMPARQMVGSNIAIALIMIVPAGLAHLSAGGVDLRLLGLLLAGSAVGVFLGAKATNLLPDRPLKLIMVAFIVISAVATIIKAW